MQEIHLELSLRCYFSSLAHLRANVDAIMQFSNNITSQSTLGCISYTVWWWHGRLQVPKAAIFTADKSPPEQSFITRWAFTLHWQEVGRLWLKETSGKADHMTAHVTGWVETAELLWPLEENTLSRCRFIPFWKLYNQIWIWMSWFDSLCPRQRWGISLF